MSNEKEKLDSPGVRESDSESFNGPTVHHGEGPLHRQLKNRHIAMISIGGVIGTGKFFDAHPTNFPSIDILFPGLFLGTAGALSHGGPLGLFLGYIAMGTICYSVMVGACFPNMVSIQFKHSGFS